MSNHFVEPYDDMSGLRSITKDDHGNDCEGPFLRDLRDSLRTVIHDQQRLGQTNQQAKYVQHWGEVLKHVWTSAVATGKKSTRCQMQC